MPNIPNGSRNLARTQESRKHRAQMGVAERLVCERLKRRRTGFAIRRQYAIGPYLLDFYCPAAKLGIEVDGPLHDPVKDDARDAYLRRLGIETFRIPTDHHFEESLDGWWADTYDRLRTVIQARSA